MALANSHASEKHKFRKAITQELGAQRFIDPVEHASEEDGLSHPLAMPFGTFGCGKLDKRFGTSQPVVEQSALHGGDGIGLVVAYQSRAGDFLRVSRIRISLNHI